MSGFPRSTRWRTVSGIALVVGPLQFLVATTVEAFWLTANGYSYSFLTNTISNLGDPSLVPFPYYWLLNGSAIALGGLVLIGMPGYFADRPGGPLGTLGAVCFGLVGIGAIGVGVFNEHLDYPVHISFAALAFVGGGVTLLLSGVAAWKDPRWKGWAAPTVVGAFVTALALIEFGTNTTSLLGHGGWERLVVAPAIVWVLAVGVRLLREPEVARDATPSSPAPNRS